MTTTTKAHQQRLEDQAERRRARAEESIPDRPAYRTDQLHPDGIALREKYEELNDRAEALRGAVDDLVELANAIRSSFVALDGCDCRIERRRCPGKHEAKKETR